METLDHLKLFEIHVLILFVVNDSVFQNITPRLGGVRVPNFIDIMICMVKIWQG